MKTPNNKTSTKYQTPQAKTGLISLNKIKNSFHFHNTIKPINANLSAIDLANAINERENQTQEIENEIKRASARPYANALVLR